MSFAGFCIASPPQQQSVIRSSMIMRRGVMVVMRLLLMMMMVRRRRRRRRIMMTSPWWWGMPSQQRSVIRILIIRANNSFIININLIKIMMTLCLKFLSWIDSPETCHIAKNWLQIDILCPDTDYFKIETVFSLKPDVVCLNIWYYANSSLARSLTKIRQSWICWYNHIPWNSCDSMNRDLIFYRYLYTGFPPFFYLLHNSLFCPVFLEIQRKYNGNTTETSKALFCLFAQHHNSELHSGSKEQFERNIFFHFLIPDSTKKSNNCYFKI